MPTITLSLSDEDYQMLRAAPNKSAKAREILRAARNHKCPKPNPSTDPKDMREIREGFTRLQAELKQATAPHGGWRYDPRKGQWVR
jgi:hypothetical protein